MNITITIDKSTFQMLSYNELLRLSNYYRHNVAPVLVMEILGDLKKEAPEGKVPADRVTEFASKLFPTQCVVNAYYRTLVKGELLGNAIQMDGRPTLDIEKIVQTDDGRKGFVIEETAAEQAVYKWKDGKFTEADHELSQLWRTITTQEDLLKNLQKNLKAATPDRLKSLEELNAKVQSVLADPERQESLLVYLIDNYGEGEINGATPFTRWLEAGRPLLKDFIPYCAHCLKIDLLFHLGLQSELIGTKATNRVDLEYLYYLPFCNVFTSDDKIHKQLAPLLVRKNQQFITGAELKKDFKGIVEYLEKEGEAAKKKFSAEPPIIEESLTFKLWKEYFGYPKTSNMDRNISPEELEHMKRQMDKFIKASKGEKVVFEEGESEEFIVKKSYMSPNDPCFCMSGKKVTDCCIPMEEFIKLSVKDKG